jgi:hypothetical protein
MPPETGFEPRINGTIPEPQLPLRENSDFADAGL